MIPFMAFLSALLFAAGLALSGMTNPAKVINFLDVTGSWDPSLLYVMAGAVGVNLLLFRFILRRPIPLCETEWHLPRKRDIDTKLVGGAVLFGVGWGLAGVCPGPIFTTLTWGRQEPFVLLAGFLVGALLYRLIDHVRK